MSPDAAPRFSAQRLLLWSLAAVLALAALTGVLYTQRQHTEERWAVFLAGSPAAGAKVFQDKGCVRCHAINGTGGALAPDLARRRSAPASLPQLVTAMWNHAPQMWQRMRVEHVSYPELQEQDVARLLAFLYMSGHADEAGNPERGRQLFVERGCIRCHALHGQGGKIGPDLAKITGVDTPMAWTQAMWNHASAMQARMQAAKITWPQFQGHELNDLFSYVLQAGPRRTAGASPAPGDPENGWRLFQSKNCNVCHEIREEEGRPGPSLGPGHQLPPTYSQVGGLMISHAPQMHAVMKEKGIAPPQFEGAEMTDVIAFLYSLRYNEPAGSALVGRSVFAWRGCSRCHGEEATGTTLGPGLRGRALHYNAITLATALWRHGGKMYQQSQHLGIGWPTLEESDVGDLLAFLNAPVSELQATK